MMVRRRLSAESNQLSVNSSQLDRLLNTEHRLLITGFLALWLCAFSHAAPPEALLPESHRSLFETYCYECHDSVIEEGEVNLETISFNIGENIESAELWQKILNSLNSGEMPPEEEPQIPNAEKTVFLDDLSNQLVFARKLLSDSGGKITMRRLNRREYANTIEHLTGASVDVSNLPADGGAGTFDTVGASLFISSDQFEQYLKIGRAAIDESFARQAARQQGLKVIRVEPENTVNPQSHDKMRALEDTRVRFLAWKAGVDKAIAAPENREIVAKIFNEDPRLDPKDFAAAGYRFYIYAQQLKGAPNPTDFGFTDDNKAVFSYNGGYERTYHLIKRYSELPHSDRGTYLKVAWGIQRLDISPDPKDLPPGTYKLRVRAGTVEGSDPSRHFFELGHPQRVNGVPYGFAGRPISGHQITGTIDNPEIIETQIKIGAHTPREFGIQEKQPTNTKARRNLHNAHKKENGYGAPPAIWVDWIELEGPLESAAVTAPKVTRFEPETAINPANEELLKNWDETRERFLRWKVGVDKAVSAPENREMMAEIRKKNLRLYYSANLLEGTPDPTKFGFRDAQDAGNADRIYNMLYAYYRHYADLPHRDQGTYLKLTHPTGAGITRIDVNPPGEMPPGTYVMRIRAGAVEGTPASRRFVEIGHRPQDHNRMKGLEGLPISSHQVTGTLQHPEILETYLNVTAKDSAKARRGFAIQERHPTDRKQYFLDNFYTLKESNGYGFEPAIWIDWIELEGPLESAAMAESKVTRVEPETTINPANEQEIVQIEDAYTRFIQWQKGVDAAAKTPANQAKIAEIGKTEPKINHPIHFYRLANLLEGAPDPAEFGFRDSGKAASANPKWDRAQLAYHKRVAGLPHRDRGAYLKLAHGTGRVVVSPKDLPPGNYVMRVRVGAVDGAPPSRRFIQVGHPQRQVPRERGLDGQPISSHQVAGTIENPETIEIPLSVGSDTPKEFAIQEKQPNNGDLKALWGEHNIAKRKNGYGIDPAIWIDWVELEGPLGSSPQKAESGTGLADVLAAHSQGGSELQSARGILADFAVHALRGAQPDPKFIDQLLSIHQTRREAGEPFDVAIRTPLSVILASPGFLYLNEPGSETERRTLSDRELAVRLAYFLWSAPPDQELLALAQQNQLREPKILREQVDRLIADPRSDEFVSGFVHQWLDMERLDFFQFDTKLHREFDESARSAARQEVYHSFAHLLRSKEEGQLGKLLNTDYVYVNGLLATYYGIDGVTGDQFRKVDLPDGSPRGGLLGMAAIHAMGSDGVNSSPVERGAWVLRHLLNNPPPPAPPNVPQISRLDDQILTTRERLSAHMEEAQCANCHRKIDPIGFGLENFNAAGKWRATDHDGAGKKKKTWKIDASGAFYNGPAFGDYYEMRELIAEREGDFARGFVEHLIEYALGRPFGFTDEDLADEVLHSAKNKHNVLNAFIHAIAQSEEFRSK